MSLELASNASLTFSYYLSSGYKFLQKHSSYKQFWAWEIINVSIVSPNRDLVYYSASRNLKSFRYLILSSN